MSVNRLEATLQAELAGQRAQGTLKGAEAVVVGVVPASGDKGPRYLLDGYGQKPFLRMNSNGYLGMPLRPEIIAAEEETVRAFGTGPGAVRFISGTYKQHVALEAKLARFHGREAGMIFSSAYATICGTLVPLITSETLVISDALNHNCIINALRLARPAEKGVYKHLDYAGLEQQLEAAIGKYKRVIVVTDGVFSMRGDFTDLSKVVAICERFDAHFEENVISVVADSLGTNAYGATGRGTEEVTQGRADILVATLGKALGVNGGYVVARAGIIEYLREKSPFYIYSNPITQGEAAAALAALEMLDSPKGVALLKHLSAMTARFEKGLVDHGYETIPGPHPVVPLMVRDTEKTAKLTAYLKEHGILVTGLNFPVVPKGDEELRFQVSADHTVADIDYAIGVLAEFQG